MAVRRHPRRDTDGADDITAAWRTNNAATIYLVEQVPAAIWTQEVPGCARRTVRAIAAHLHNSRCAWIRALGRGHGIQPPPLVDTRRVTPRDLIRALERSSKGMVEIIELARANGGRVPRATWQNFPTDLAHFLAYFAAHEGHHRGQLLLIARQLGHRLPRERAGGVWQWTRLARGAGR
jgi:uncharacterized damage-inducible protein DinB